MLDKPWGETIPFAPGVIATRCSLLAPGIGARDAAASTLVEVRRLLLPEMMVEIEVVARLP